LRESGINILEARISLMREFTKSMVSFSWAMSLFSMQQLANLFTRQDPNQPRSKATDAFDCVTQATEDQLGDTLKETFKAGDKFQREMINMMFGGFRMPGMNPGQMTGMASDTMQQATGCCGQGDQGAAGWGPMPPGGSPTGSTGWGPMPPGDPPTGSGGA
jgi:hypothetical protein